MPYADPEKAKVMFAEASRKYAARYPERIKERSRRYHAKVREYAQTHGLQIREARAEMARLNNKAKVARNVQGLTSEEYRAMHERQQGQCALCRRAVPLCVDHEHVEGWSKLKRSERTKHVRGLLCAPCNMLLGYLKDDADAVRVAVQNIAVNVEAYLKRDT